jgi:hypothetical protein
VGSIFKTTLLVLKSAKTDISINAKKFLPVIHFFVELKFNLRYLSFKANEGSPPAEIVSGLDS